MNEIIQGGKKYNVIYADPAWRYNNTGVAGAAEKHYQTMSIEELCKLPVKEIAADDAFLFLWVTFPILYEAQPIFKAWGFEYKALAFSWLKRHTNTGGYCMNTGFYIRGNCEICLLGTRGDARSLIKDRGISSVLIEFRKEHSRKPSEARDRISRFVGNVPKIELFARRRYPGWDAWGNELEPETESAELARHRIATEVQTTLF